MRGLPLGQKPHLPFIYQMHKDKYITNKHDPETTTAASDTTMAASETTMAASETTMAASETTMTASVPP